MAQKTGVKSLVESYQRLKKWSLMPPCLTFSIIKYISRVKWSNPGKGVVPSPIPRCSSYWKGSFQITLDYHCQLLQYRILLAYNNHLQWIIFLAFYNHIQYNYKHTCGIIAKVLEVNKFELQLHYIIHFWTHTLGKCMHPLIPLPILWIVQRLFSKSWHSIEQRNQLNLAYNPLKMR